MRGMTHFMRSEAGVVQLFHRIFHVFVSQELDDSCAVFKDVRIADIARLSHVILEVLPRAGRGKA